ncbi:MAG: hypothetical protein FVQ85_13015 [Planctomycetes bacterium]|nr:hypothetical protein [Planctomycetota bacterium]
MIKRKLWIILVWSMTIFGSPFTPGVSNVYAYRPFVSTDAAVVEKGETEIEIGLFGISHDEGLDEITIPSLIYNYGLSDTWEFVAEFDVQVYKEGEERDRELKDPALFLKGVLQEGILQGKEGTSIAVEFGALLPSTVRGKRDAGIEGIGILSGKASDLTYHFNFGGELDREDFGFNAIWGIILEYPLDSKFRVVGEVNGTFQRHGLPSNSGLIGFIWELGDIDLDFGIRRGFSDAASDWELATGITFSF